MKVKFIAFKQQINVVQFEAWKTEDRDWSFLLSQLVTVVIQGHSWEQVHLPTQILLNPSSSVRSASAVITFFADRLCHISLRLMD